MLLLFAQPKNFSAAAPAVRTNFNTSLFLTSAGLSAPIGGDMFLVGDSSSGPTSLPNACGRTTSMPSAASTTGLVTFTSSASGRFDLSRLVLVSGLIFLGMLGL